MSIRRVILTLFAFFLLAGCTDDEARDASELPTSIIEEGGVLPDGGRVYPSSTPEAAEIRKWSEQEVGETITVEGDDGSTLEVTRTR